MMMQTTGQEFEDAALQGGILWALGERRWHALIVPPQGEDRAEAWLRMRGVYAFHPVTYQTKIVRGRKIRRESRYLPGYVFARFAGPVRWHILLASPFITDAIRLVSRHPAILKADDLRSIHAMRSMDEATADRERRARSILPGDTARILSGPLAGQEVQVGEIRAGKVVFTFTMFGAEREHEISLDAIEKQQTLAL